LGTALQAHTKKFQTYSTGVIEIATLWSKPSIYILQWWDRLSESDPKSTL